MANHRILFLLLCVVILIPLRNNRETQITFIDVGQGDGIYLNSGEDILIDCGSSSTKHIGENTLEPFLLSYAVDSLDKVFVTHADSDHTSGILYLAESGRIHINSLYLPCCADGNEKYDAIRAISLNTHYLKAGDTIPLKRGRLTVLSPNPGTVTDSSDINKHSLVLLYKLDNFSALLMGDADKENEIDLLENHANHKTGFPGHITVLKAGHHGSSTSTGEELLEAVTPDIAVLSYGTGNRYGHPHRETLDILDEYHIPHLDTADSGAISFYTNGHYVKIKEFLNK